MGTQISQFKRRVETGKRFSTYREVRSQKIMDQVKIKPIKIGNNNQIRIAVKKLTCLTETPEAAWHFEEVEI